MSLSRRSIESLLDLVDNKLTSMFVSDREDAREQAILEAAKNELQSLTGSKSDAMSKHASAPVSRRSADRSMRPALAI